MTVIQVYYPDAGAFGCWEPIIQAELDRLGLTDAERKRVTVICLPESMKSTQVKHKLNNSLDMVKQIS